MTSRAKSYNVTCDTQNVVETLYTCPDNCRTKMVLLYVVNVGGNTNITILWDRADGTEVHILGAKNIGTGEYIQWSDSYIVLEPGDAVTVVADAATPFVDMFCTVEEFFISSKSVQS